jgi:putative chitinase|tara:strand:+ start:99 stop:695 length:597 start_codon:yes stop_codon:yes gene_type:complete
MVNKEQLKQLHIGEEWVDALNETFTRFDISNPARQAAFIGQASHESGNFKTLNENLNYRAETLMRVWPKRFPTLEFAKQYEKNPKKIANSVYSNRMGNRDEASGDGYRFRGRGLFQLTGHSNYFHAGKALGEDFVMNPDLVATPRYATLTAAFFWQTHKLNDYADARDYLTMTKRINGGTIGLQDRIAHINHALSVLG